MAGQTEANDRIISGDELRKYISTRLFGRNISPEHVRSIVLCNGFLPSQLEEIISQFSPSSSKPKLVEQDNPREPIFTTGDVLYVCQYSSLGRQARYEDMIQAWIKEVNPSAEFKEVFFNFDASGIRQKYEELARKLCMSLVEPKNGIDLSSIHDIVLGPLGSVETAVAASGGKVIKKVENEYLSYQILSVGHDGRKAILNFNYVYADQTAYLLESLFDMYYARAISSRKEQDIKVFMFGRAGALDEKLQINDIVTPTYSYDEHELMYGQPAGSPLPNLLASGSDAKISNLNASTVVNQTYEQLRRAKNLGCVCVEMEAREAVGAIRDSNRRYDGKVHAHFGCALHISDKPLLGETLAKERDLREGEGRALKLIFDYIAGH